MTFRCPRGHESTDPDYCSVCGIAMTAAGSAPVAGAAVNATAAATPGATASATVCPVCGTPRTDMGLRYCEVCRYDYQTGAAGPGTSDPSTVAASPAPSRPAPPTGADDPNDPFAAEFAALEANAAGTTAIPPSASTVAPAAVASASVAVPSVPITGASAAPSPVTTSGARWEVRVSVDPSLDTDPDPGIPVPANEPDYFFPLTEPETLIGRRDDRQGIRPQIPLRDPGVSRRHAMIRLDADGISVMDLGSTNGTMVNGSELPPNSRRLLQAGDEITLGRWTRITLRSDGA